MTRIVCFATLAVGFGLLCEPVNAQPKPKSPTVAEVLGKLKEKRDRGGNQVYKMEFERTGFGEAEIRTCRVVKDFQIDWPTGKFRLAGWDGCKAQPFEQIEVYDGERIKNQFRNVTKEGKPIGDGAWKYALNTGRLQSRRFEPQYWPLFFHKGVVAANLLDVWFYPGHFVFDADEEKFYIHGEVLRDGRKCISLKTFPDPEFPTATFEHEYIIDPNKD